MKMFNHQYGQHIKAVELDSFPFEKLSLIAERESWRKEINRPIYYIHKWWGRRLGSVFRAIIIATFSDQDADLLNLFYQPVDLGKVKIFDPFMGSGTTVGEAIKLGAIAIGRDINPVAYSLVKNALTRQDKEQIKQVFADLEKSIADRLQYYYTTILDNGDTATVLYYFWVKYVLCPSCHYPVDLFSSYIFAKHAYPQKFPIAQAICPHCGEINQINYNDHQVICQKCQANFHPHIANVKSQKATCPHCNQSFSIVKVVQQKGQPPAHRMYAKLVLHKDGTKQYLPITKYDQTLYQEAQTELNNRTNAYPKVAITPGENTNQILNYCYHYWHQMFSDRQLLCLSILAEKIKQIDNLANRELFICLFSGTVEFNNLFASFKGEGTGAVRHLFSHHILKPERTPIEANIWGTPKSSGAFSTLFTSRIIKAIDYCQKPFEIKLVPVQNKIATEKIYNLSPPINGGIADIFNDLSNGKPIYISCGDSGETDLPKESIDAIITDPPFFDNVNYSELADFFYVWQRYLASYQVNCNETTRHIFEVQAKEVDVFTQRLKRVFNECYRVLKADGLMVFTYHHSKPTGWQAILTALIQTNWMITATHPIKSEMSLATPKSQAKDPIDLDMIIVCRKRDQIELKDTLVNAFTEAEKNAKNQIARFHLVKRNLSKNDIQVIFMAQIIKQLSWHYDSDQALNWLKFNQSQISSALADYN